ncbi:MAG: PEP-CTERM sorting domain-containing protein [Proteobacteria bacterium]|nr:PEP-CTERM sorting domain-containing protein [Pseudomonadota bacterium]MBU1583455.1 PEP-CTERM sorting domain-containing protein [Pseudomonadota bacterium]MBU2454353.1 PEP-CTERM sorting domain-containing protein [Pseudomonadota bacterium]MBU2631607.1 PEP-CTERM sorting domain-containing protein [Pseudomonadota bacterium]
MKKNVAFPVFFLFLFSVSTFVTSAFAAPSFGFKSITNNLAGDAAIGSAQLHVDLTADGSDKILFTFVNDGPFASSITDIYFDDDDALLSWNQFQYDPVGGVDFSVGANPPNLPGGNAPAFNFSANHSYDSNPPAQPNGVNPGESLGIRFTINNSTFDNIITALTMGDLRVGIHVQGFATGGSESFVNTPPDDTNPTPEPATMILLGFGLIGLAGIGRRTK